MERKINQWKKIVSVALAATILCTPVAPLGNAVTSDVYGASSTMPSWAEPYLRNLVNREIMRGDENGDLRPNDNISRGEFAALVNRTFGFDTTGTVKFGDVKKMDWFNDDISIAANQGYFAGMSPGKAAPNSPLTREQAVTMLCRAVKIPEIPMDTMAFADSKTFQFWSKGSIYALSKKGFVSGFNDQTFKPQQSITRAEVAKILSTMGGEVVQEHAQVKLGYVNGNVTLNDSGAGLRNTTINGDLYITEGVGAGYIILDGVTVTGDVIISGCGESNVGSSSIVAYDCNFANVIIDVGHKKTVSLIAEGDTVIKNTVVKSTAYIEERNSDSSAFENIQLKGPEKTSLDLNGNFDTVTILGPKNVLNLRKGRIERLIADEEAKEPEILLETGTYVDQLYTDTATTVKGKGEIDSVVIQTNGTKIEGLPNDITIRPGVTANINGKDMTYDDAERDKATPQLGDTYPEIIEIQPTGATAVVKVNKPGKIYWMVKMPFSNAPSADNLKDPKKATGVVASGTFSIAADKELNTKLNGLISGEEYVFYAMLEDVRDDCSSVESKNFRTIDNVKPAMITGYPDGEGVYVDGQHKLKFTLVPSKTGFVYWATLPKGSIAPTVDILINDPNKVPGALDAGKESCVKNEVGVFYAEGLKEATIYDTYLAVKDESGNNSQIFKLTTSTLDVTPPDWQKNYPKMGNITNTSANVIFMTDETCTVYWAVYPRGTKVPSSFVPGIGIHPDGLNSPEAQQEIITGNNALKFGKTNATVDREGNFTISGLAVETPYDLYCVLVDQTGNKSSALKKEINTKDDIAPTAKLEFDPAYVSDAGEPKVGSNIRLAFSEIVYDGTAVAKTALSSVPLNRLGAFIQVYDVSSSPRMELTGSAIDFSKAVFSEENGKTILTFSTGEGKDTGKALKLASGNRYVFELRSVTDSVGNKMKTNAAGSVTKLEEFRTMSPFISLKNLGADINNTYDVSFEVDPKLQNSSPELCFDVIVESDTQMHCNITRKTVGINGTTSETTYKDIELQPKKYYSMETILNQNDPNAKYIPFNDLTKTTYYMEVTNLDGIGERALWNKKLVMDFRGVSGTKQNLTDAAHAGNSGPFDDILGGLSVTVVSDPMKLTCNRYFSDANAPEFMADYPKMEAGDTSISVRYMANKTCTAYWLLAPAGTIQTTPDAIQIINGSIRPVGSKQGKLALPNGKVEFSEYIKELQANTNYEFYYVLKENTASPVGMKKITTATVVTPQFANGYPEKAGQGDGQASLRAKVVDADAKVFWVCFATTERNIISGDPKEITASEIAGAAIKPDTRVIDSGEVVIGRDQIATIVVKNLKSDRFYDVFLVAKNPLADPLGANWSTRAAITGISAKDLIPPAITEAKTSITGSSPGTMPRYNGEVDVTFTEALYYQVGATGKREPLTKVVLEAAVANASGGTGAFVVRNVTLLEASGGLIGFRMAFTSTYANASVSFPFIILDSTGNPAGTLQMTFEGNKLEPQDSKWNVSFK